jgi:pimeloyl-ACP methyl ester carboxylesterase
MTTSFESWHQQGKSFAFESKHGRPASRHRIFYQLGGTGGAGAHLLLVHGLPTASWDFHRVWPELTARCASLLAPDMLGFGWSDKPARHRYSIFEQADLHEELLRLHGITHFRILAHDYGVTVAQELLARHAERLARGDHSLLLESVCLLNGGLFPETHRPLLIQRLMLSPIAPVLSRLVDYRSFKRSFRKVFGPNTQPTEAELREFWQLCENGGGSRVFHRLFHYIPERKCHRERWVGALQQSKVPLLLVNGPLDPVSGAHMVARYRELVPNPDTVSLPGIGHYPHVEDPAGVLTALAKQL